MDEDKQPVPTLAPPQAPPSDPTQAPPSDPTQAPPSDPTQAPPPQALPDADAPQSDIATVPVVGKRPEYALQGPLTPDETKRYLEKHADDWANDLKDQHITPKTYKKLFNDESTPGKILTLFGLLVGGGGQEGPVMSTLNKVIQNDLDAQKQSKANAQNFIRMNQEHQVQEMQKGLYGAQTDLAKQQAGVTGTHLGILKTNISAASLLRQQMEKAIADSTADPTNQQKQMAAQRAQQTFGLVANQLNSQNSNLIDNAAAQQALMNSANPQGFSDQINSRNGAQQQPSQQGGAGVDWDRLRQLTNYGKANPNMPGMPNASEQDDLLKEAGKINQNRTVLKNYKDVFKDIYSNKRKSLNQPDYDALTDLVAKQWAAQLGMGADAASDLKKNIFPSLLKDWDTTAEDKYSQGQKHFEFLESNTPTVDKYKIHSPIKIEPLKQETYTQTATDANGNKIGKNSQGKWVPIK